MSTVSRLLRTPLSKLVRGRIDPTSTVDDLLAASDLPDELRGVVSRVVRRARLHRRERADVAAELIAHFTDALADGESPASAAAAFGDEKVAARLLRRAVIRKRSLLWHASRALGYAWLALVVVYLGMGVYFLSGTPAPKVDYVARINAPALAVPEPGRAWPVYRAFYLDPAREAEWGDRPAVDLYIEPTAPAFPALAQHLRARRDELARLRAATARPLGFVLGKDNLDPGLLARTRRPAEPQLDVAALRPDSLYDQVVTFSHLGVLRHAANVLAADVTLAAHERDFPRAFDDLDAILALSRQAATQPMLVDRLVAIGIRSLAVDRASRLLVAHGPDLPADRLRALERNLARESAAADLITFDGERALFYDLVQRSYTDDGAGSGRITPALLRTMSRQSLRAPGTPAPSDRPRVADFLGGGAALAVSASRRDLLTTYDRLMDLQEGDLHRNPWDRKESPLDAELTRLRASTLDNVRYLPLIVLVPSLQRSVSSAHISLGYSSGLRVAIALELHRRDHGSYPATLAPLAPAYLPELPKDLISGGPLLYLLRDGHPVVYSVGVDRTDDHATYPKNRQGRIRENAAAEWPTPKVLSPHLKGDWILYPPAPEDQAQVTP